MSGTMVNSDPGAHYDWVVSTRINARILDPMDLRVRMVTAVLHYQDLRSRRVFLEKLPGKT